MWEQDDNGGDKMYGLPQDAWNRMEHAYDAPWNDPTKANDPLAAWNQPNGMGTREDEVRAYVENHPMGSLFGAENGSGDAPEANQPGDWFSSGGSSNAGEPENRPGSFFGNFGGGSGGGSDTGNGGSSSGGGGGSPWGGI